MVRCNLIFNQFLSNATDNVADAATDLSENFDELKVTTTSQEKHKRGLKKKQITSLSEVPGFGETTADVMSKRLGQMV